VWSQGGASVYRKARTRRERRLFVRIGSSAHRARALPPTFSVVAQSARLKGGSEPCTHASCVSVPYVVLRLVLRLVLLRVESSSFILRPCPGFARVVSERMSSLRVHIGVQVCDAMAFSAAWIGSTDVRAPLGQGARLTYSHSQPTRETGRQARSRSNSQP
jgi:hypothetical protein